MEPQAKKDKVHRCGVAIELGDSHQAVKTVMRWNGGSERTVKNWLAGRTAARGEYLLALIRHSNVMLEIILSWPIELCLVQTFGRHGICGINAPPVSVNIGGCHASPARS